MELINHRTFNVDYYEKDDETWKVVSHLSDEVHDITVEVDISVPDMVIKDAAIKFDRYPLEPCPLIESKSAKLTGVNVTKDYRQKVVALFMGPEGCPNVMNLLGVSVAGIAYFYFPHQLKTGNMKLEEWMEMIQTTLADDCLAHTVLNKKSLVEATK
jgi:hypothetical protein